MRDIMEFIEVNYFLDRREFYLMRNVESLRAIGIYLEGETRVFYPDFVLWIVDEKARKTTLALFDPKGQTGILWKIHSFILLRDSSPLGRFKGSAPTDLEMELAEEMIQKGVLRLDWHEYNELGQRSIRLRDEFSYLSRIFERLG